MPKVRHERLPNVEAIAHFNGKVLLTTQSYAELKAYEHALAFTVAKIADQDMLSEVHKAVKQAIESGTSFNDFKKTLKPYLMAKGWLGLTDSQSDQTYLGHRLKTIYHTNKQTAYAAGRWQRIQRTKEMLPYLQYLPSLSTNQRDSHTAYYDLVRPVDDPIWQSIFPPNGFGCKCRTRQLTRTKAQKILDEQAEKGIVYDIEMEEVKHPLTGEMVSTLKGVHFSFNHNHDRLTALLKLAEDKHGGKFKDGLGDRLKDYMVNMANQDGIRTEKMSQILTNTINALALSKDPSGNNRLSEGILADKWEQHQNVKLERYDDSKHKVFASNDPADYAIMKVGVDPKTWLTLDFMFTLEPKSNVAEFNRSFHRSEKAWEKRKERILQHLNKADIIPMYLKHMDAQTYVKIISFVLSLPQELQQKIVLVE